MRFTVEALVIKEMKLGERDRLITLMTRDYGVLTAYAAGANSIKSKKGSATGLLSYSNMTINQKGDTYRIEEATPIKIFFGAGSDIKVLSLSQYFCELCLCLGLRDTGNEEFLRLILNSLYFLTEEKRSPALIKAITELRIMTVTGYAPNLVACEGCGKFEDKTMYFNIKDGCLLCENCKSESSSVLIEKSVLEAMRHIVYSQFERLYSFAISEASAEKLSEITEKYLIYQTERGYNTLDFYNSIKG